ncbi:MAG: hypothetical protein JWO56_2529 [Acidobacteria bacterium]|nr:hypothetical protein [Acidobacteriota bacterium]
MRKLLIPFAALLLLAAAPAPPEGTIQFPAASIKWSPGPLKMPPGTMSALLEGDPAVEGQMFTLRLKLPARSHLSPHFHSENERVTVISGEAQVGFGDTLRDTGLTSFPAGSFYVNPKGAHHFVVFPKETVVQITGRGPWRTTYLKDEK